LGNGTGVGGASVLVADVRSEEFEEASCGVVAEVGNQGWDEDTVADGLADRVRSVGANDGRGRKVTVK
jgi:hypothetical protein